MNSAVQSKKICLIGDFGVGKTSIVARFVNHSFSDKYRTTVGVSVKTKLIERTEQAPLKLVLWDIAGDSSMTSASERYVRGSDGFILVVDGTRPSTLATARNLANDVTEMCGDVPLVALANKRDLEQSWELGSSDEFEFSGGVEPMLPTSAKTGSGVEAAFQRLAAMLTTIP